MSLEQRRPRLAYISGSRSQNFDAANVKVRYHRRKPEPVAARSNITSYLPKIYLYVTLRSRSWPIKLSFPEIPRHSSVWKPTNIWAITWNVGIFQTSWQKQAMRLMILFPGDVYCPLQHFTLSPFRPQSNSNTKNIVRTVSPLLPWGKCHIPALFTQCD